MSGGLSSLKPNDPENEGLTSLQHSFQVNGTDCSSMHSLVARSGTVQGKKRKGYIALNYQYSAFILRISGGPRK